MDPFCTTREQAWRGSHRRRFRGYAASTALSSIRESIRDRGATSRLGIEGKFRVKSTNVVRELN